MVSSGRAGGFIANGIPTWHRMISILVEAIVPIALVVMAGVWAGQAFALDLKTLSQVNIYVLLPALVLTSIRSSTLDARNVLSLVLGFVITTALLYLIAIGLGRWLHFSMDEKKSLIATTVFANVGNLGLPFILFTLGEAGLERAIVYLITSSIAIATVFPIVLQGEGVRRGIHYTLRLPVFWATLGGLVMQGFALSLPQMINRGVDMLWNTAIPIALLTLGIQLARTPLSFGRYELFGASLRLLVSPLLAYGVGRVLGLRGLDLQVLVMQSAMPVAVNSLIWVTELGGDRIRVAKTIVLSTLMGMVTLPMVLWLSDR
jgi:malate permease and related proteins